MSFWPTTTGRGSLAQPVANRLAEVAGIVPAPVIIPDPFKPAATRKAITEQVEISATYKIEKTDVGATLRRDGDVVIRFPNRTNPDQITVRDNAIVTFMRRKFRNMFKEEFAGQGIKLKGRFERAGTLRLAEIKSDAAWLALGWKMPEANPPAAE